MDNTYQTLLRDFFVDRSPEAAMRFATYALRLTTMPEDLDNGNRITCGWHGIQSNILYLTEQIVGGLTKTTTRATLIEANFAIDFQTYSWNLLQVSHMNDFWRNILVPLSNFFYFNDTDSLKIEGVNGDEILLHNSFLVSVHRRQGAVSDMRRLLERNLHICGKLDRGCDIPGCREASELLAGFFLQ